ncbi:MAG: hypothetical protein M3Y56_00835 [Armatimonadota bacterium]|nr:hypothetical protein [Armatimonadota bacterium]
MLKSLADFPIKPFHGCGIRGVSMDAPILIEPESHLMVVGSMTVTDAG